MNYFSVFIPKFTDKARPLYEVLREIGFKRKKKMNRLQVTKWPQREIAKNVCVETIEVRAVRLEILNRPRHYYAENSNDRCK